MSEEIGIDYNETGLEIAIIGMAARLPGAADIREFWNNLLEAKETITFFTEEELRQAGVAEELLRDPAYVPAAAIIEGIDLFDASVFDINHREAEVMDPQSRMLHQCAWHALEDAGYNPFAGDWVIGCYVGASSHFDWEALTLLAGLQEKVGSFSAGHLADKDYMATRLAYNLNLKGPAVSLHTACSTSLVAVHLACQGLLSGDCDMALAGGATVSVRQKQGYLYSDGMITSPDGHCRAFDQEAAGTVFGHGVGVVLLKRLEDAQEDLDHIYAIIKGSSINNDGSGKAGYTAPSIEGQASVVRNALRMAEVESETIGYVEAHGTGTNLGDPVEIEGLTLAFATAKTGFCGIGSVKTNIGHLDIAAGVAGLIKVALVLHHKRIPSSLHFNVPNPNLNLSATPFYVVPEVTPLIRGSQPLRASVSSFGIGGTNSHAVLEEAPDQEQDAPDDTRDKNELLLLSAATPDALEQIRDNLTNHLEAHPELSPADVSYTLKVGRKPLAYRALFTKGTDTAGLATSHVEEENPQVIFMFPGQGAQYAGMALDLYKNQPAFRRHLDECLREMGQWTDADLHDILYPGHSLDTGDSHQPINQTAVTQPLLFAVEYAMARLLMSFGVKPAAMIGHSIGEYTAACLSGMLSLADTCRLVVARGKGMQGMPAGAMVSLSLPQEEVLALIPDSISLAAVNSPSNCVVSGPFAEIDTFVAMLENKNLPYRRLHTSHAFHSSMMEPMIGPFVDTMAGIEVNTPTIPVISNVSAGPLDTPKPDYWGRQVREAVRFSKGIEYITSHYSNPVFLEIGPGKTLGTFVRNHQWEGNPPGCLHTIRHPNDRVKDDEYLETQLGHMWLRGIPVDWQATYDGEKRRRISLPTYPFQPVHFPVPEAKEVFKSESRGPDQWFYTPSWKTVPLCGPVAPDRENTHCLIVGEDDGLASPLADALSNQTGAQCIRINLADLFERIADFKDTLPAHIIFTNWLSEDTDEGFYTLLNLAQAIGEAGIDRTIDISILTANLLDVAGNPMSAPRRSTILGAVHITPTEYPNLSCKLVDIDSLSQPGHLRWLLPQLAREILSGSESTVVAYRGKQRLLQVFESSPLPVGDTVAPLLKEGGVYVVTGGLGGIGLELADYLAETVSARLALMGRSGFPPEDQWDDWLASHGAGDPISRKVRKLFQIRDKGASLLVLKADAADRAAMKTARKTIIRQWGAVDGIIHAAGVPGGGVIQLKTREMAGAVMRPKVEGTIVLDEVFDEDEPDFILLCSSINAVVPMAGQVDYTGANAFLDTYCAYRNRVSSSLYMCVNWDPWLEVGMAAEAALEPGPHPLLEYRRKQTAEGVGYSSYVSMDRFWVLSEHTVEGQGVMTGTTYIEMVRAAAAEFAEPHMAVEIQDVHFLYPLMVGPEDERHIRLVLTQTEDRFDFTVESKVGDDWLVHARGVLDTVPCERGKNAGRLDQLRESCGLGGDAPLNSGSSRQEGILKFGSRWQSRDWIKYGKNEGLARLQLPPDLAPDLDSYHFHPALMDLATAFLYNRFSEGSGYMPFSYNRITIKRPLTPVIFSYARLSSSLEGSREFLTFDLTVFDEAGEELVDIEGFTMMRFTDDVKDRIDRQQPEAGKSAASITEQVYGIEPSMGVSIFARLLDSGYTRMVVSVADLESRLQPMVPGDSPGTMQTRPGLTTPFVQPEPGLETEIAGVWSDLLGIDAIGAEDDFFELGGDSLKAITAGGKLHKATGIQVPLGEFFNRPTIRKLAQFIGGSGDTAFASIPKADIKDYYPLSPAQKKLYVIHYMEPDGISLNLPNAFILDGPLEVPAVRQVFESLIQRHEALRTSFETVEGSLVQKIHDSVEFNLEYSESFDQEVEAIGNHFVRPFMLDRAPLIRGGMVKLEENRHLLFIDVHHIVYDRVSKGILYREFRQLLAGETLPPLTVNYRDYSQWQSDAQRSEEIKRQEAFWLERFGGEVPQLSLPYDFPRTARQTFDAGHIAFAIGPDEAARLKAMATAEGATLQMLMLAIFYIMLAKLSGQDDITVGTPIAGRFHPELEGIVGVFINSLALRNFPAAEKSFMEFFREVKENSLQAYQNQGFQFEDLVERLGIPRDQGRNPLYDVMFEMQKEMVEGHVEGLDAPSHKIMSVPLADDKVLFDIDWVGLEIPEGINFQIKYNKRLFEHTTMELFTRYFQILSARVLQTPDVAIGELEHRTSEEIKLDTYQDVEFDF
jgi:acyl transferase domain-containing protein/acyl carrier protein